MFHDPFLAFGSSVEVGNGGWKGNKNIKTIFLCLIFALRSVFQSIVQNILNGISFCSTVLKILYPRSYYLNSSVCVRMWYVCCPETFRSVACQVNFEQHCSYLEHGVSLFFVVPFCERLFS